MAHIKRPTSAGKGSSSPHTKALLVRRLRLFIKKGQDLIALLEERESPVDEWPENGGRDGRRLH